MPANGPVKIIWQIIFTFIPILDLWAFYRIKKLRRYFLYVVIPVFAIIMTIVIGVVITSMDSPMFDDPSFDPFMSDDPTILTMNILMPIIEIGFHIFSIYLVYNWSKQWNKQFLTNDSDF
jgi:amino acid transporter